MTEAYIFISSTIILGGTFWVDYLSNKKSSTQKSNYIFGVMFLLVSTGLIFLLTNYLHSNPEKIWQINVGFKTFYLKITI